MQVNTQLRKAPLLAPRIGGILSENPLSLNPGRFDQYMDPYYEKDLAAGAITEDAALELIEALWLKYSEWVWTISANTADYFAGYNQFQNLTVGGKTRDGHDGTNPITYLALKATVAGRFTVTLMLWSTHFWIAPCIFTFISQSTSLAVAL